MKSLYQLCLYGTWEPHLLCVFVCVHANVCVCMHTCVCPYVLVQAASWRETSPLEERMGSSQNILCV